ncbi:AAA family ATPase [Rhodococcoides fascians]|uniref:AAA family ATPase n=1 Tax=Rhodococcoides fascians TaxID=1828 RepID=UPI00050C3AE7|nr:AAA family ATPase [Rhodococcus fascians]
MTTRAEQALPMSVTAMEDGNTVVRFNDRRDEAFTDADAAFQDVRAMLAAADPAIEGDEPSDVLVSVELTRLRARDRAREIHEDDKARKARGGDPSFAMVGAADLSASVPPMEWLVRNVWPRHSFGPMGGEKKTLKSYNLLSMTVAVASGEAFFGEFEVVAPGPVLYYVGEGGQGPFQRRLQAMARAYKVELADLPVHAVFEVGSLSGVAFVDALKRNLDAAQPELVIVDPLYAFHPPGVEAQNLYERGRMLAEVSALVADEAALVVADHFKKTGNSDLDLDSISQAGMGQWADSWILQKHRQPPDLAAGDYRLALEFGSRQWGGGRYDLDWHLPTVGQLESGEASAAGLDELSWTVRRADDAPVRSRSAAAAKLETRIVATLRDHPFELTASKLAETLGGKRQSTLDCVERMVADGRVKEEPVGQREGNRTVERMRLGIPDAPARLKDAVLA